MGRRWVGNEVNNTAPPAAPLHTYDYRATIYCVWSHHYGPVWSLYAAMYGSVVWRNLILCTGGESGVECVGEERDGKQFGEDHWWYQVCTVLYCTGSLVVPGRPAPGTAHLPSNPHYSTQDCHHCAQLCCTGLYCSVLFCTVLWCTVMFCTVLHCMVKYCTVLYCTEVCDPGLVRRSNWHLILSTPISLSPPYHSSPLLKLFSPPFHLPPPPPSPPSHLLLPLLPPSPFPSLASQ